MNELKPEDVMRALDILDKMYFFEGQRAGRELWFEKPFEVQEQDITDFSQGIAFLKNLVKDAIALLRDKQASIEMMAECIKRQDKELAKKDAEIESLTQERDKAQAICVEMGRLNQAEIAIAHNKAIDEFAEKLTGHFNICEKAMYSETTVHEVIVHIAKELKGEK